MKRKLIACAVAALSSGAALAAPTDARIALSAGASAAKGNLVIAMNNLCTNAGGVFTTFTSPNDTDITTHVCANSAVTAGSAGTYATKPNSEFVNFAGTSFAEFRLNVDQGSFSSAQILNGVNITHFDPGVGAGGQDETPSNGTIVGGLSDVEFSAFPAAVQGSFTVETGTVGVGQTFGVGVSGPLYTAMFNAQRNPTAGGGATPATPIPNSCAIGDTGKQECIPIIGSGQMAAIMDSNEFGAAKLAGAGYLAPALGTAQLRYVRRVDTSGTQASAQNFFLGLVCSTDQRSVIGEPQAVAAPEVLASDDYSNLRVLAAGATSGVRTELNRTLNPGTTDPSYAIGVLSGENTSSTGWRWLRIDGAAIGENAVPGTAGLTNAEPARAGRYPFFYETKYHYTTSAQDAFWTTVSAALNSIVPPTGLLRAADLQKFSRGGTACKTVGAGS
jgi:hypothetical protein